MEVTPVYKICRVSTSSKKYIRKKIKVTYAADWNQYHSVNGEYNMSALWDSENIDIVGIYAYFPLSDSKQPASGSCQEDIECDSGEGYDYFHLKSETRTGKQPFSDSTYA